MIPIADIRYAERIDKHIDYHLTDNTVIHSTSFNCSFQNAVSELLSHKRMLLVGSSFVVNLFHVTEVTRSDLLLTGELRVPVPAVCTKQSREWADFWLNGGRYYAFEENIIFDLKSYDHLRRYFCMMGTTKFRYVKRSP